MNISQIYIYFCNNIGQASSIALMTRYRLFSCSASRTLAWIQYNTTIFIVNDKEERELGKNIILMIEINIDS